ncbi:SH3 domain protein [Candidatus Promineifilum breve]|uniref:SH3 domain protein n=2 Tax=Candidatus Promineifilum breve TaxID=1806508 RepID=A0A170PI89_9CHLR|nr:SH3 domain protein [Candidatus Promineifilum breve]
MHLDETNMTTYRAVEPWSVHYPDPIRGAAGDRLTLGRRDDEFPGWVWATAGDGREGWVPESWLRMDGGNGTLLHDYTAAELALEPGDVVSGAVVVSGWLWATAADGRVGWAPLHCLVHG